MIIKISLSDDYFYNDNINLMLLSNQISETMGSHGETFYIKNILLQIAKEKNNYRKSILNAIYDFGLKNKKNILGPWKVSGTFYIPESNESCAIITKIEDYGDAIDYNRGYSNHNRKVCGIIVNKEQPRIAELKKLINANEKTHTDYLSRDGIYISIRATRDGINNINVITYIRREDLPSFPELKETTNKFLPKNFLTPPHDTISNPIFPRNISEEEVYLVDFYERFKNLSDDPEFLFYENPDNDDLYIGAEKAVSLLNKGGFDAFAWYQPFHSFV